MFASGRTTRSSKRKFGLEQDGMYQSVVTPTKKPFLSDETLLTPPASQPLYETTRSFKRRQQLIDEADLLDQGPSSKHNTHLDGYETRKLRRNPRPSHNDYLESSHMRTRQGVLEPTADPFPEELSFTEYNGVDVDLYFDESLVSAENPFFNKGTSEDRETGEDSSSNLDTPQRSPARPDPEYPETPNPRPATPGESHLTSIDTGVVSSSLDSVSLLGSVSFVNYGPPSTPCPDRVGNLSSSSLIELPLTSASTTATSAAPPINILESDDDIIEIDHIVRFDNSTSSLLNDSPNSPPPLSLSKHSHRLRIKAPPPRSSRSSSRSIVKSRTTNGKIVKSTVKKVTFEEEAKLKKVGHAKKHSKGNKPSLGIHNHNARSHSPLKSSLVFAKPEKARDTISEKKELKDGALDQVPSTSTSSPDLNKDRENRDRENRACRDGCILSCTFKNFMTHSKRTMSWNPHVNVIRGENGSGKSAILTGIMVAFGATAADIRRAKCLQDLVTKTANTYGTIEICLSNYNGTVSIAEYGETLTISRKIPLRGSPMYYIGSNKNKRILKANELRDLTRKLHIYPTNPAQFLQQDRFGRNSDKHVKKSLLDKAFRMFTDATQLTSQKTHLQESDENLMKARQAVKENKEIIKFYTLRTKQLKEKCDVIRRMEESENRVAQLKNEYCWAIVKEKEDELDEIVGKKEAISLDVKKCQEDARKIETEMENFSALQRKNEKKIASNTKELGRLLEEYEERREEFRKLVREQRNAEQQKAMHQHKVQEHNKEIRELEGQMNEYTINYEEQNHKLYEEIRNSEQLIEDIDAQLEERREERLAIMTEMNEYKNMEKSCSEAIKKLTTQQNQTQNELNKKEKNFGKQMMELLKRISKCNDWIVPPAGPLGAHIRVSEEEYAPLIEHILYGCLFTFVVQNQEDFNRLRVMINSIYVGGRGRGEKQGKKPEIIVISDPNIEMFMSNLNTVKRKMANANCRTVHSMLVIKDKLIEMGVIETTQCERIVLFETTNEAALMMKEGGRVPSEVKAGYTLQWYRVNPYPRYQFQPLPGMKYKTDYIPMGKVPASADVHIKANIAQYEETIATCRANLKGRREGNRYLPGLEERFRRVDETSKGLIKEKSTLKNRIKHAQSGIREVTEPNQDKEANVRELVNLREEREKQMQEWTIQIDALKRDIGQVKMAQGEIDGHISSLKDEIASFKKSKGEADDIISKHLRKLEACKKRIKQFQAEVHQLFCLETKCMEELNLKIRDAHGSERPKHLHRRPEDVQGELKNLKEFLRQNVDKLKAKTRIFTEYKTSKEHLEKIISRMNCITHLISRLQPYVKIASDLYEKNKRDKELFLKQNFRLMVEAHGLTGELLVIWEDEILVFYVNPDKASEFRAMKNFSKHNGHTVIKDIQGIINHYLSLSGGERSKALVFFIMAIWKITDLPFHVLDEFENFLDKPSTALIHRAILQHAKDNPNDQFFILTPLDTPSILENDPYVSHYHLMKRQ